MVKPDVVIGNFVKDFNFNEFMGFKGNRMSASEESSSMESTSFLANMSTFIFIGLIGLSGVVFMIFMMFLCGKEIRAHIKAHLTKVKNATFFGGSIKA